MDCTRGNPHLSHDGRAALRTSPALGTAARLTKILTRAANSRQGPAYSPTDPPVREVAKETV